MIDFLTRFFRREEASSNRAKERLRLVLMSDRVSLAPDIFDAMKGEMLDVLRRYLEIDERGMDVHFENAERQFALMANIPVREVKTHEAIVQARKTVVADLPSETTNGSAAQSPSLSVPRRRRRRRARPANIAPLAPQPSDDAGAPPPAG